MEYKKTLLSNGLRIIAAPMPSLDSATVTVWVKAGSRNEDKNQLGISHFMEHMAFKGGRKYKSAKEVSEAVDAIGGEFNAYTTKEKTAYYIRVRNGHIETAFDVLSDMIVHPLLKAFELNKEKGVIVEEIGMREDKPSLRVWELFGNLIFKGNTLGNDVIGTKKSVTAFTRNDFVRYRERYYYPENMLISVAGGVEVKQAEKLAKKYFGKMKAGNREEEMHLFGGKKGKDRLKLHSKKTEQANFVLGFPGNKYGEETRYAETVLETILSGGMSSRLFTEVREKRGLAYSVGGGSSNYIDTGYFCGYAGVAPNKAEEAIKVIVNELNKMTSVSKAKITQKEFAKAKEFLKGRLALSLESTSAVNGFLASDELILGRIETIDEYYKGIDRVQIEEVTDVAKKLFDLSELHLAIIGPYNNDSKFRKILNL